VSTIPGGKVVTHKIPDQKHAASPHDRDHPQASKRPDGGKPYSTAKPQVDNAASLVAELKAHRESLSEPRTDR
jgi:hypothetical protein